jgi:hypothetical protein
MDFTTASSRITMAGRTDTNSLIRTPNKSKAWWYLCKGREKHVKNFKLFFAAANEKTLTTEIQPTYPYTAKYPLKYDYSLKPGGAVLSLLYLVFCSSGCRMKFHHYDYFTLHRTQLYDHRAAQYLVHSKLLCPKIQKCRSGPTVCLYYVMFLLHSAQHL